jgi:hypothetical protein
LGASFHGFDTAHRGATELGNDFFVVHMFSLSINRKLKKKREKRIMEK